MISDGPISSGPISSLPAATTQDGHASGVSITVSVSVAAGRATGGAAIVPGLITGWSTMVGRPVQRPHPGRAHGDTLAATATIRPGVATGEDVLAREDEEVVGMMLLLDGEAFIEWLKDWLHQRDLRDAHARGLAEGMARVN